MTTDFDESHEIVVHTDTNAAATINKSEVEAQLDAAHRYPRSIARFQKEATSLATLSEEIAQSCIYAVPRDGKNVTGPSVRLAEICMAAYGNFHAGARVLDAEERHVVAQGVAWDIEKNVRVVIETKRRITGKSGKRFGDDMITLTGNAAAAIAFRNAVFKVIPRALVDAIYTHVRKVAVGDVKTLPEKRKAVVDRLMAMGAPLERIFARLGKRGIEDVGLEDVEVLIGLGTAIKDKGMSVEEAFPAPDNTAEKAKNLEGALTGKAPT